MPVPADPNRAVAQWIPAVDGPLPTSGGVLGGSTVNQGAANASPGAAWHVKPTDAAGVNQAAITAAGDQKVTLDGEIATVTPDTTGLKFARINLTASGAATIVAAVGGKKIRVLAYVFTCSLATTVQFQDDVVTVLAGPFDCAGGGGVAFAGGREAPAFETGVGAALQGNLSITSNVRGHLCYIEV